MSPRSHKIRTTLALTMALGAVVPAAGQARLATDPAAPASSPATVHDVKSAYDLRRAAQTSSLAGTVDPQRHVITVSAPSGFDWGDAAIGAAGGLGLALAAVGGTLAVAGRRRHSIPRELAS
jgi:hypothetical protein